MTISVHLGNAAICSGVNCGMNRGRGVVGLGAAAAAGCACAYTRLDDDSAARVAAAMASERTDNRIISPNRGGLRGVALRNA
jgi:hypothetical protein